jgi:hypothetical protein
LRAHAVLGDAAFEPAIKVDWETSIDPRSTVEWPPSIRRASVRSTGIEPSIDQLAGVGPGSASVHP